MASRRLLSIAGCRSARGDPAASLSSVIPTSLVASPCYSATSRRSLSSVMSPPSEPTFTISLLPSRHSNLGVIELNNAPALNALTLDMVRSLNSVLPAWQSDPTLRATLFVGRPRDDGKGGKKPAFCAGGDVKSVYEAGIGRRSAAAAEEGGEATDRGDTKDEVAARQKQHGYGERGLLTADFFREEYTMNHRVATQIHDAVPQVSVWDGVVMGGGVGISVHGKYRVATERTLFAMPETGIGLFPDVGGMWWLPRLKGGIGQYIALTGARLKADDLMYAGIATHYIPSDKLEELREKLTRATETDNSVGGDCAAPVLMSLHEDTGRQDGSFLSRHRDEIEAAFGDKDRTVEDVLIALENMASAGSEFGKETLSSLRRMSPTSLKVTHEGLRRGAALPNVGECLKMEYRMAQGFMRDGSDFYEGIRALLVDKDKDPRWNPKDLEEVTDEAVRSYFANLGENELVLDGGESSRL